MEEKLWDGQEWNEAERKVFEQFAKSGKKRSRSAESRKGKSPAKETSPPHRKPSTPSSPAKASSTNPHKQTKNDDPKVVPVTKGKKSSSVEVVKSSNLPPPPTSPKARRRETYSGSNRLVANSIAHQATLGENPYNQPGGTAYYLPSSFYTGEPSNSASQSSASTAPGPGSSNNTSSHDTHKHRRRNGKH